MLYKRGGASGPALLLLFLAPSQAEARRSNLSLRTCPIHARSSPTRAQPAQPFSGIMIASLHLTRSSIRSLDFPPIQRVRRLAFCTFVTPAGRVACGCLAAGSFFRFVSHPNTRLSAATDENASRSQPRRGSEKNLGHRASRHVSRVAPVQPLRRSRFSGAQSRPRPRGQPPSRSPGSFTLTKAPVAVVYDRRSLSSAAGSNRISHAPSSRSRVVWAKPRLANTS